MSDGAEELGVELGEHIEFVRDAMATIADELELPPHGPDRGCGLPGVTSHRARPSS